MDIIIVIILILLLNSYLVKYFTSRYELRFKNYLWTLFTVHFMLTCTYIFYTLTSRSDSVSYFLRTSQTTDWQSLYMTGTKFVGFLAWPFINKLGLSYFSMNILFSFFGYLGVVFFYLMAQENIKTKISFFGLSVVELVFLLPNLHFWTSSLGKGSAVFLGIGLFAFGLSRFNRRIIPLILGSYLIFMIRPHILLAIVLAVIIGIFITSAGIKPIIKWLIIIIAVTIFINISDSVLKFTDVDSLDILSSSTLSHRTGELGKSNSGVDIQNYNLFFKMFTFWFRPLFIDGLGILGFIVSFENAASLLVFFFTFRSLFKNWSEWNGFFRITLFIFLLTSFILAQVSGNLGIAMRQKSQCMPFLYLLYCKAISIKDSFTQQRNPSKIG